jgi:hypothetical protein
MFKPFMMSSPAAVAAGAAVTPITVGNNAAATADYSIAADFIHGNSFQAASSGTLNTVHVRGHSVTDFTINYRLAVYAASSATVWSGAKLGETAQQTTLNHGEDKVVALTAPVSVTSGQWYAIVLHAGGAMGCGASSGTTRAGADTYSDGSGTPAAASFQNSASVSTCIWAVT